jgi:penicillin-binding protein 1B
VRRHLPRFAFLLAILVALVAIWAWRSLANLEERVEARFEGRLFAVPSRVYSRPLELRPGVDVERPRLRERLERMGYVAALGSKPALRPGEFRLAPGLFQIYRRASRLPDRNDPARLFSLRLADSRIAALRDQAGELLPSATLEPEIIAQFHGDERADRRLEALADVPPVLVDAIIAVEDQSFFEHGGVHLWRIAGAMLANLRAGRVVQGGSTITQQLAKNFYLTRERTLTRKATEALMALLLERNHTKREILEAYLNEVYMGQRGSVAIHGVGEASQHYFGKQVGELTLPDTALLAGMIKGPNLYSPYKHPEAARKRRDLVLSVLREQEKIERDAYESALIADLGVRDVYVDEYVAPYFVEELRGAVGATARRFSRTREWRSTPHSTRSRRRRERGGDGPARAAERDT